MKHDELVNCLGTKDSSCYWLFIFTSWGTGDAGQNTNWKRWHPFFWLCWYWRLQKIELALIKVSALLKQEFEKQPSPSAAFLLLFGSFSHWYCLETRLNFWHLSRDLCEKPGSWPRPRHQTASGWWHTVEFWGKSTQRLFPQLRIILATK